MAWGGRIGSGRLGSGLGCVMGPDWVGSEVRTEACGKLNALECFRMVDRITRSNSIRNTLCCCFYYLCLWLSFFVYTPATLFFFFPLSFALLLLLLLLLFLLSEVEFVCVGGSGSGSVVAFVGTVAS